MYMKLKPILSEARKISRPKIALKLPILDKSFKQLDKSQIQQGNNLAKRFRRSLKNYAGHIKLHAKGSNSFNKVRVGVCM